MRRKINNLISVIYSFLRVVFYKGCLGDNFKSGYVQRISPNVVLEFSKSSHVNFGKRVRVHSGSKIKARPDSNLYIGDNVKINYYCIVVCREKIEIGEGTEIGPSVYIFDHDHDYQKGLCPNGDEESYKCSPIIIGKNCWIGANTIILRGTKIGDNAVIGAGSVVKGDVPAGAVLIQKRVYEIK